MSKDIVYVRWCRKFDKPVKEVKECQEECMTELKTCPYLGYKEKRD